MTIRFTPIAATLTLAGIALAATLLTPRHAQAEAPRRADKKQLLVVTVTKGFRHDSIPVAEETIKMLGDKSGAWETDFVRTDEEMQEKMTPDALKKYDAVVFANTTGVLPLPDPQGFLDYIKAGHGFVAMHSGSDTFHKWPGSDAPVTPYIEMLGGEFLTHHSQCAVDIHILDPDHPATKPIAKAAKSPTSAADVDLKKQTMAADGIWKAYDEIYLLKNNDRSKVHVLLALDKYPNDGSPDANKPEEHLISWSKSYGSGRVFYTVLGHRKEIWNDPLYQQHVTGAIEFALGLAKGSTTPSPALKSP